MKSPLTPGLLAAKNNPDVVFLEMDVKETSPKKTMGFSDEQIEEMNMKAMLEEVAACNKQEQQLNLLLSDLRTRKFTLNEILMRKAELS